MRPYAERARAAHDAAELATNPADKAAWRAAAAAWEFLASPRRPQSARGLYLEQIKHLDAALQAATAETADILAEAYQADAAVINETPAESVYQPAGITF
jgi:hypothetical protein